MHNKDIVEGKVPFTRDKDKGDIEQKSKDSTAIRMSSDKCNTTKHAVEPDKYRSEAGLKAVC